VDWLTKNVHLAEITAYSDDVAYTIFETMRCASARISCIRATDALADDIHTKTLTLFILFPYRYPDPAE
jgi:hypothetical protein